MTGDVTANMEEMTGGEGEIITVGGTADAAGEVKTIIRPGLLSAVFIGGMIVVAGGETVDRSSNQAKV